MCNERHCTGGATRGRGGPGRLMRLVAVLWLAWTAVAVGQADDPRSQTVTVLAIRATRSNKEVSPELRSIAKALRRQFRYTGYKLVRRHVARTRMGRAVTADLGQRFKAAVTPLKRDKSRVELRLKVTQREGRKDKTRLDTTVKLPAGRYYLVGGWKYAPDSEDVLIVAVAVR